MTVARLATILQEYLKKYPEIANKEVYVDSLLLNNGVAELYNVTYVQDHEDPTWNHVTLEGDWNCDE